jgi:SAM-dependent methyltransferase
MEEFKRLNCDFAIDHALGDLGKIAAVLPRIQDKLKILASALTQVASNGVDEGEVPEHSYGYIPLDLNELFDCLFDLEAALKADSDYKDPDLVHRRVDFVEAGCGSGRNIFLIGATDRFETGKLHGFDRCEPLIEHGRRVFGLGQNIFPADCLEFDFASYDVVFFYRPFSTADKQEAFENRLVGQLKPGAYVIGCGNLTFPDDRRLLAKCDHGRVFKKLH